MTYRSRAALVLVVLFGSGALIAVASAPAVLRFVSPKSLQTVIGPSVIEVSLDLPAGVDAKRVILSVDGTPVANLTEPPWRAPWDAGEAREGHTLEAVAFLSDGSEARATLRTSRLHIDLVEQVALVNLYAIVRDRQGNYVNDLTRDEFRLTENGRSQVIQRFSAERKPLRIAIVLDTSLSMEGRKLEAAQESAADLADLLQPGDEALVVAFNDTVQVTQDLTTDRAALDGAIRSTQAKGGTALYDAVWQTAEHLDRFDGRRVLVLLSDGRDEASSGLEPGSLHTLKEALERALRSEVMIFAIGFDPPPDGAFDFYNRRSLESILKEMGESTGGRAFFSSRPGKLQKAFKEVAEDLRHQYSLAYTSDDARRDGSFREIRVTTTRPGLEVTTRRGYYAPRDPARRANASRP